MKDESMMLHQDWCAECTRRGAYFTPHHNWFLSTAHTTQDIDQTLEIVDDAFQAVKKKWEDEKCTIFISKNRSYKKPGSSGRTWRVLRMLKN